MKAVNKGAPSMGTVKRQADQVQQNNVQQALDPLAAAEKERQSRQTTILGGGGGQTLG